MSYRNKLIRFNVTIVKAASPLASINPRQAPARPSLAGLCGAGFGAGAGAARRRLLNDSILVLLPNGERRGDRCSNREPLELATFHSHKRLASRRRFSREFRSRGARRSLDATTS
ncbi:hypothetical protein EVAR_95639_1 [Eumeta japonica]|uniref:Uncharacterized protein n=1 Tax=Eumeta variegata TaxID=151549 RepID=A0A4C2AFW5_EUMVA|nr:hypothetical protein EVAR_95639_1 [Eumeta japonica]